MRPHLPALGGAAKLGVFVPGLMLVALTLSIGAARFAGANLHRGEAARAEFRAIGGRVTTPALRRLFDAENHSLFDRFDPAARPAPRFSLLHGFEGPAPTLRLARLSATGAAAINSGVPISAAPNPPARPFAFHGSGEDRARAITCLAQAVYYEAGFEPGVGQQAVAQVVLNRVRHPIFPHTVCGVVYQGAALKTGCQFSFTCDGSLGRTPQAAAMARARKVAEMALNGFVLKSVGEATHYHTRWVEPWWRPTVTKVAELGAHIFYRWPGSLGLPGAFVGRYAGGERIVATPTTPAVTLAADTAPVKAARAADGRVHGVLSLATNTVETPRARMATLAAQHALGPGFDPATLPTPPAPAAAAAPETPPTP